MKPRILAWVIGALTVAALVFTVSNVAAQTAPGACPFGGVCPTGTPQALRAGGGMRTQGDRSGGLIGVAAETLGVTRQALLSDLYDGKTIADVALAQGVDPLKIVDVFVAPQFARIDALVSNGVITPAQAEDAKEQMRTHITVLVSSPMDQWVRQAHDPLIGQRPDNAGQGATAQPGGRGPRRNR